MLFYAQYQVDRDKQSDTQAFFANMTDEQIAGEYPDGVTQIGRWHDVPNGNGWGLGSALPPLVQGVFTTSFAQSLVPIYVLYE